MLWCKHCRKYHSDTVEYWLEVPKRGKRCRAHYTETTRRWREGNKEKVRSLNKAMKQSIGTRFSALKSNSKKRRLEVTITLAEFADLVSHSCHYCADPGVVGIDRRDNSQGYHLANCLPACSLCNLTRNNFYTYEEFLQYIVPGIRRVKDERRQAEAGSSCDKTA